MPSRLVSLSIVISWLGMIGWLFYWEVLPDLRPGEAPHYQVNIVDEARTSQRPSIRWIVSHNGQPYKITKDIYRAETWVEYLYTEDNFDLYCELFWHEPVVLKHKFILRSRYGITRKGEVRNVSSRLQAQSPFTNSGPAELDLQLLGEINEWRLQQQYVNHIPSVDPTTSPPALAFDSVDFPRGCILNPLHPIARLNGLYEGQHWRMPVILYPLVFAAVRDSVRSQELGQVSRSFFTLASNLADYLKMPSVEAEVLPGTQYIQYKNEDVPCFKVECHGADIAAHIWVRQSDGFVLRHEVILQNRDRWVMDREAEANRRDLD